ncbi:response regulator [Aquabacterium sp. J223]|uniref:response regulator n=1 Tax=Aquabacterium sp. J223 TaxID=2898431 RepID=UPI0021AE1011|nr:response regulator transcription factor [Aquabacterium sp. J223]UUX96043.1 response regulator transcription factor [Aquabacterium sp. J223]
MHVVPVADDDRPDSALPPLRVLLVEDLPRVQLMLRELIEEPGRFDVVGVADSEEQAVSTFDGTQPDVVVVDLNLRAGTGMGVLQRIRQRKGGQRPLLIVLTNHTLPVLRHACERAGADHFLDKSREFAQVRVLIEARAQQR